MQPCFAFRILKQGVSFLVDVLVPVLIMYYGFSHNVLMMVDFSQYEFSHIFYYEFWRGKVEFADLSATLSLGITITCIVGIKRKNVNVNVSVYSLKSLLRSADFTISAPGIETLSYTVSSPLGRIQRLRTLLQL